MAERLQFQTSDKKAEQLKKLVDEGHFNSVSDGLETALTLLLEKYGKLGVQPAKEKAEPGVEV